ncbi:MAG: hypothetical protein VB852_00965 [Deltaproteobacteria bacterium]
MKRVIAILLTFIVLSGGALYAMLDQFDPKLRNEGRQLSPPRMAVDIRLERMAKQTPPALMWLGDSTIDWWGGPSYATKINAELESELKTKIAWHDGANFFHHYVLVSAYADAALARPAKTGERRAPKLIVFIANPRMMIDKLDPDSRLDNIAIYMPSSTIPRSLPLPFYDHGLTIPQILLSRVSRLPTLRERLEFSKAARDKFQNAAFWERVGRGPANSLLGPSTRLIRQAAKFRSQWTRRLGPGNSTMQMIGPTIRAAQDWGAQTLVIGTPVPLHSLRKYEWFDGDDYLRRLETLQATVEQAGGRYLNLHNALSKEHFRDRLDHYNEPGAERMVELVRPVVYEMLGHPLPTQ